MYKLGLINISEYPIFKWTYDFCRTRRGIYISLIGNLITSSEFPANKRHPPACMCVCYSFHEIRSAVWLQHFAEMKCLFYYYSTSLEKKSIKWGICTSPIFQIGRLLDSWTQKASSRYAWFPRQIPFFHTWWHNGDDDGAVMLYFYNRSWWGPFTLSLLFYTSLIISCNMCSRTNMFMTSPIYNEKKSDA